MILTGIRIEFPKAVYTIPIRSKYTVLTGNGAIGKSSMLKLDWTGAIKTKGVIQFKSMDASTAAYLKSGVNTIYVLDTDQMKRLRTEDISLFNQSACQFLFICRDVDQRLSVHRKDILTLKQDGKNYIGTQLYVS